MGSKNAGKVQETEAQRAMMEVATQQMADYRQRWMPVQVNLAKQITSAYAPDSFERERAAGMATAERSQKFEKARGAMEQQLTNAGAAPGSSKFNLAMTGLAADEGQSKGLGLVAADQAVANAYTRGLTNIMNLGQGQKATAESGMADAAALSGSTAASDAKLAANERSGYGELLGTGLGMAYGSNWGSRPGAGMPDDVPTRGGR